MVSEKDLYRTANLLIKQHGLNAEAIALQKMEEFAACKNINAASTWLGVAQCVVRLQSPKTSETVH